MGDILPPLLMVLTGMLLVLLVTAIGRRRRATASRSVTVSTTDTIDRRELVDTVLASARRSHGRHSAAPPVPSGVMLLLLVPTAAKRRRRPHHASAQFVSIPTDSADEITVIEQVSGRESDAPAIALPSSAGPNLEDRDAVAVASEAEDIRIYRHRVNATVQAMSRRMGPGESPELVEARMLAAVDRLDAPMGFARPTLSPSGTDRSRRQPEHLPQGASPAAPAAAPAALPQTELIAEPPDEGLPSDGDPPRNIPNAAQPEGSDSEAVDQARSVPEDEAEVVLPVPPIESSNETRRRGLRRRGKAG